MQLQVTTSTGEAIAPNRLSKIELHTTNSLGAAPATWPKMTNLLTLATNGVARLTNTIPAGPGRQFFTPIENP